MNVNDPAALAGAGALAMAFMAPDNESQGRHQRVQYHQVSVQR